MGRKLEYQTWPATQNQVLLHILAPSSFEDMRNAYTGGEESVESRSDEDPS